SGMSGNAAHVVVADGDPLESGVLSWVLREGGYDVSAVASSADLLELLRDHDADLVLLHVNGSPGSTDQTLRLLRADEHGRDVPVLIAGIREAQEAASALRNG